jgi:iron complex outermembrane receptor protein
MPIRCPRGDKVAQTVLHPAFAMPSKIARALCLAATLALLALFPLSAHAQRTDENVTAESDDAFGRSVGNESIGIYNVGDVRGFSPIDAGNVRIEGLYFDRQTDPTQRLVEGSAIRVGIAAQSYPFPSPTGIVDYTLRRVGEKRIISTVLNYGPFESLGAEVDAQIPIVRERFGIATGVGMYRDGFPWGGLNEAVSFAIVPLWKPTPDTELRPFFSRVDFRAEESEPLMLTAEGGVPPKIRREHYYGQRWAQNEGSTHNYGLLARTRFGAWTARLGVFESVFAPEASFAELFTGIDAAGNANERVIAFQDSRFASRSGELRLSRAFEAGNRRHSVHVAVRGRIQKRRYGGEDEIDAGPVSLGVGRAIPEPDFQFGAQSRDEVKQQTAGIAYELQWKDVGELSVGVQKTSYSKTGETPLDVLPESEADPMLENVTATVYATKRLAIYGSYTQGLEESPIAPEIAINRNVAAPALLTKQYDVGLRWEVIANLKLIAGLFSVEKPHFDLDAGGLFRSLGTVEHRGVELSLTGTPVKNLSLVAGTRILDATVSGATADAGLIGEKPVGTARTYSVASFDYALAGTGLSLDATLENISKQVANTANTFEIPGRTVLHLGGRYRFKLFRKPATLRAQVQNVFDRYGWISVGSGAYVYNAPRRITLYVAADL